MSDGFVYFIQEEETGNIKIGFSEKHPEGRLKDFQTGNSNKLILKGYIEGTYQDESNLHQEFSEERIRKDNEWFKSSPRLEKRIKEMLEKFYENKKSEIEDLNFESTEIFDGEFNEGEGNGKKKFTILKDITCKGKYKDGEYHGQGTKTSPDGWRYFGEFKDGEPNGQGIETFPDGRKHEGEFKNGYLWNITEYDKNGKIIEDLEME